MIQVKLHKRKASLFKYEDIVASSFISSTNYYGYKSQLYVINGCELSNDSTFCVIELPSLLDLDNLRVMFKQVDYSILDDQLSELGII